MNKATLLFALAFAASASQAKDLEHFTASARGTLTIGADGSVLEVEVKSTGSGKLSRSVEAGYEQYIRSWRFEPVIEDGKAVNAVGHMRLSLVATREKGSSESTLGIRDVWFIDPPSTSADAPGASLRQHMPPPSYPRAPASDGIGADVLLAVRVGASGEATEVGTRSVNLLGNVPAGETLRNRYVRQLTQAAERRAGEWKFQGFDEGAVLQVPVRFTPNPNVAWLRTVAVKTDVPAWIIADEADRTAVKFDGGGQQLSTRIQLATELRDPIDPASGG